MNVHLHPRTPMSPKPSQNKAVESLRQPHPSSLLLPAAPQPVLPTWERLWSCWLVQTVCSRPKCGGDVEGESERLPSMSVSVIYLSYLAPWPFSVSCAWLAWTWLTVSKRTYLRDPLSFEPQPLTLSISASEKRTQNPDALVPYC